MVNALDNIAKYFDTRIVMPLQQVLVARRLLPINTEISYKGIGMQTVDYWKFNDISNAIITYEVTEHSEDSVDVSSTTIRVPIIKQDYKIPRRAYESFLFKGTNIDAGVAIRSSYKVGLLEDQYLIDGWKPDGTNYEMKGLFQIGTNSETTAKVIGQGTSNFGNMIEKVAAAISALEADKVYGPYNLVLNPAERNHLLGSISTTGVPEFPIVQKMLMLSQAPEGSTNFANSGGIVYSTPSMTAGNGMILPVPNYVYFDLIVAQDFRNVLGFDSKLPDISPIYGSVYAASALRVKFPESICKLTNMS